MRARVERARQRQLERFAQLHPGDHLQSNAQLTGDRVREAANPTPASLRVLSQTLDQLGLSARAWSRMLKVARTLADLDDSPRVDVPHVLEAAAWRPQIAPGSP